MPTSLGFSIDLPGPGEDTDDGIGALRAGWTWWRSERGTARPVVLLRSSSSRAATRAVHALHGWAAGVGSPAPTIRLDITGVCTTIAASTVVTVLTCTEHPGVVEVVVDQLPPTWQGVRVAGGRQPDLRTDVLIRDAHRMVATHLEGGGLTPGARLIAGGWSGRPGPVSVLGSFDAGLSLASHDRFSRADAARTRTAGHGQRHGTGLGLAIVASVMSSRHGTASATNNTDGPGVGDRDGNGGHRDR